MITHLRRSELFYCVPDINDTSIVYCWFTPINGFDKRLNNVESEPMGPFEDAYKVTCIRPINMPTFILPYEKISDTGFVCENYDTKKANAINENKLIPWMCFPGAGIYGGTSFKYFFERIMYSKAISIQSVVYYVSKDEFYEVVDYEKC